MTEELECLRDELDRVESKVMPFGSFRGVRLTDLVRMHPSYLLWIVTNVPLQPPLRNEIIRALREHRPQRWRPGDPIPGQAKEKPMEPAADLGKAHLRVARPTDDLDAVTRFYRDGLGFAVVGTFKDHDGFDGIMLGHAGAAYHLEFTRNHGHEAGRAPTEDNLIVFYYYSASAVDLLRRGLGWYKSSPRSLGIRAGDCTWTCTRCVNSNPNSTGS